MFTGILSNLQTEFAASPLVRFYREQRYSVPVRDGSRQMPGLSRNRKLGFAHTNIGAWWLTVSDFGSESRMSRWEWRGTS